MEPCPSVVRELVLWPVQKIALGRGERGDLVQGMAPQSPTLGLDESFSYRVSTFPSVQ